MARDAALAGDRIAAENYYQHAEHYFRTLNASGGNGTGERHNHHHMNTPSDPMGDGDGDDGDEDMPGNRPNSYEQRPNSAPHAAAARPIEQPRVDPAQAEQPRTDMPVAPSPAGTPSPASAPQPHEARGQGDNEPRRRGPNGRRRPPMHDGQGPRHGGNPQGGQGAPARDPRSISPASPAEAASTESDPIDTEKPSDA
jgi:hypothetical protein